MYILAFTHREDRFLGWIDHEILKKVFGLGRRTKATRGFCKKTELTPIAQDEETETRADVRFD